MADPLTDDEVHTLRDQLIRERDALLSSVKGSDERSGTVDLDGSMGRLSRMDALQQQEMALAQSRQAEVRLKVVLGALRRVETDDYGWCPDCGEPIGMQRLSAKPEAPFCVACTKARGG